jgi:hypothetical protein
MPNGKQLALGLTVAGAALVILGLALMFGPLVLVVVGAIAFVAGGFGVDL